MRVCSNCGKANQPIRKFCIRCGRKLIKKIEATPNERKKSTRETGKVTTEASMKAEQEKQEPKQEEEDRYVRPSEVARDRVRTSGVRKRMTEMEKAQMAFQKANAAGIEEAPSGIVESRMLRPSEVHELLEGPSQMPTTSEEENTDAGGTAGAAQKAEAAISGPKPDELEEQLLGSHSAYISKEDKPPEEILADSQEVEGELPPEVSSDFTSSKYEEEGAPMTPESKMAPKEPSEELEWDESVEPEEDVGDTEIPPGETAEDPLMVNVTSCPHCGEVINVDTYEYSPEVYSAMGRARLKQARFFIVQGKYEKAQQIVRIAYALLTKAGDEEGLKDVQRMIDSLARKN